MGKSKGGQRTRHWGFIAYPESVREDWKSTLSQLGIQAAISPLHDSDLTEDGKKKKPHWHVVLVFDGVKSQDQIEEITGQLVQDGVKPYLPVRILSLRGTLRYFTHMDDLDKAQYKAEDVVTIGGLDYYRLCSNKDDVETQECCSMGDLMKIINEHKLTEFAQVADWLLEAGDLDGFATLRKNSYFFGQYLKSKKFFNNPLTTEN